MFKNVSNPVMLLLTFAFFMSACSNLQKAESPSSYQTSKSPRKKTLSSKDEKDIRNRVAYQAKKYRGARYKYGGKGPKNFDCSGFTSFIMKKVNISISGSSSSQARLGRKIPIRQAKAGDLVFFGRGKKITHVALVLKNNRSGLEVIHSTSSKGVIVQNVSQSNYWKPRMLFARDVISRK